MIPSDTDALAALAEHRLEASRETKALLAAQQIIWRFFTAPSGADAAACVDFGAASPAPEALSQLVEPTAHGVEQVTLLSKRRLPEGAGYESQWAVVTQRHGELTVKVSDRPGSPRLLWSTLAPQLRTTAPLAGPAGR